MKQTYGYSVMFAAVLPLCPTVLAYLSNSLLHRYSVYTPGLMGDFWGGRGGEKKVCEGGVG